MSPASERRRTILDLECELCHKHYAKKEHLQRHERTHTGVKPFACQLCGRSFARQDALNRHARVHSHRAGSAKGSERTQFSPVDLMSPNTQHHNLAIPASDSYCLPPDGSMPPMDLTNPFEEPHLETNSLFWPDSEYLLQNIMSIDPVLWEQPFTFLPTVVDTQPSPLTNGEETEDGHSSTSAGDGQRAIQTLSALISNTVHGVTTPAVLANLTSRFLDSCLHMFFSAFIPMIPVIHRPTFVFRECSPPLLLNAIAIGSLFLGTSEASAKGDALWRLAHTAVSTSWHAMINLKGEYDSSGGGQLVLTALLSQVYATLAKSRTLRMTSQVFHGLGIYWARYCGLFDLPDLAPFPSFDDSYEVKHSAWRFWLAREAQLRTLLGLYILDGVISQFSGNPTFAQHMSNLLPTPSDEHTFSASNPDEWIERMSKKKSPESCLRFCDIFRKLFHPGDDLTGGIPEEISLFSIKVVLEGIKSLVAESRRIEPAPIGVPSQIEIDHVLDRLRHHILASQILTSVETSTAMLRWHAICLDALTNTARGARRLCYPFGIKQQIFGGGERFESDINPVRWITSDQARRSLLHAAEIQRIAAQLPLGLAHDPHLPGAVFAAATTFAAFALAGKSRVIFPQTVDWETALLLPVEDAECSNDRGDTECIANTVHFIRRGLEQEGPGRQMKDLSYELSSIRLLLRGLSLQWGVSMEMEEVVDAWIARCS